ncbi:site-specific integrase [Nocardioides sp. AN3]
MANTASSQSVTDLWEHVDRKTGERVRTARYGVGNRYRARYRDTSGREHSKTFPDKAKRAARDWLAEVTASVVTGQYVDPKAGSITFQAYAEQWRAAQVHRPSSADHVKTMLHRHVYPRLGSMPLSTIAPTEIQALVKYLATGDPKAKRQPLAPSTIGVVHGIVAGIFRAAIRDKRLTASPCDGTRLPKQHKTRVQPLALEQVETLLANVPPELRAFVVVAAGTGMRQGELLGLTRDRLRLLGTNPIATVDRQLVTRPGRVTEFGPPKTAASVRDIPLPRIVVDALNEHLAAYAVPADGLVFTLNGRGITRQEFSRAFRPAARAAKLTAATGTGVHALRHYYASSLIRYGESVKTVQARLGHASAAETLDTYSHLWPDSDERTREALDNALGGLSVPQPERNAAQMRHGGAQ